MPGDLSKVAEEWDCSQQQDTPGYFKSLNGAEVADSTRSQLYPCASFLGSMDGNNQVFAYRFPEENEYYGVLFINNRRYRSYKNPQWIIDVVEYEYEQIK